jgi:hypothetical protein
MQVTRSLACYDHNSFTRQDTSGILSCRQQLRKEKVIARITLPDGTERMNLYQTGEKAMKRATALRNAAEVSSLRFFNSLVMRNDL